MNFFSVISQLGKAEQLLNELAGLTVLKVDALALKAAIEDDLGELKAGTLTLVKLDTLQAAAKLLGDVGGLIGRVGSLTGNVELTIVGSALSSALGATNAAVEKTVAATDINLADTPLPPTVDNGEDKIIIEVAPAVAVNVRPGPAGRP